MLHRSYWRFWVFVDALADDQAVSGVCRKIRVHKGSMDEVVAFSDSVKVPAIAVGSLRAAAVGYLHCVRAVCAVSIR